MKPVICIIVLGLSSPALAAGWDRPQSHRHINCDTVRSYVQSVGFEQARAVARASGMTASEERSARRCLAQR